MHETPLYVTMCIYSVVNCVYFWTYCTQHLVIFPKENNIWR